ncbi:hypothetical protein DFA_06630 [Cavenderia fasciculata]|uniref:SPRY domain-containing protein n=1 Tax=Cavenderia fasciculata TaxID=261658 RepID=F4Q1U4_CACFS|nr:uncharacterized protein DFA_06630 [Cavenderia fasciculata]EGG17964.1 hypothetical protein DFA_06630 [Cavenderia fasciculata]|eukprot:XP_004356856.1 hypothetical protein DFA_06630 [Cavenderia fasciculata]
MSSGKRLGFKFNQRNVKDRTRFSGETDQSPISFSDDNETITRVERSIGDDFPSVRVVGDTAIPCSTLQLQKETTCGCSCWWDFKIQKNHGFIEIGIIGTSATGDRVYFLKPTKKEVQYEENGDYKTQPYGDDIFEEGDNIRVIFKVSSNSAGGSLSFEKNGKSFGTAFGEIPLIDGHPFYPMVGLNDQGDSISIV